MDDDDSVHLAAKANVKRAREGEKETEIGEGISLNPQPD